MLSKVVGLYQDLIWQASSEREADDIRAYLGPTAQRVVIAPDFPSPIPDLGRDADERKPGDPLRLVFLARIAPSKNLDYALRVLEKVTSRVVFTICGPIDNTSYWIRCESLMRRIPPHVQIHYRGIVPHSNVLQVLRSQDLLFLPTRSENYGHVVFEALSVGTPVLIANTTPWRNLEAAGVGWDLPLDDEEAFASRIDDAARVLMSSLTSRTLVQAYARQHAANPGVFESNRRLFREATQVSNA